MADIAEDSMDYDAVEEPVANRNLAGVNAVMIEEDEDNFMNNRARTPVPEDANVNHMRSNEAVVSGYDVEVASDMKQKNMRDFIQVDVIPYDIEYITENYDGHALTYRLEYIITHCPPMKRTAIIALINHLRTNTENTIRYSHMFQLLENIPTLRGEPTPTFEKDWVAMKQQTFAQGNEHFQAEYKKQKDEGVKESTRRAMEDLFQHLMRSGRITEALRLYSRGMREYCTQFKHSIQMYVNYIEGALLLDDFLKAEALVTTAVKTIRDAEEAEKSFIPQRAAAGPQYVSASAAAVSRPLQTPRQLLDMATAKITAAHALVFMSLGKYRQAADKILEIKVEHLQPKWLVIASDLGAYATICALATFSRMKLKQKMGSDTFRKMLDSEPIYVDMMQSFIKSQFDRVVDIYNGVKNKLLLDPYISQHLEVLFKKIQERILIQFLEPFSTVKIERVAQVMRTTPKQIELALIDLLERGEVKITIDRKSGMIRTKKKMLEGNEFERVVNICDSLILKSSLMLCKTTIAHANATLFIDKDVKLKRKPNEEDTNEAMNKPRSSSSKEKSSSPQQSTQERPDLLMSADQGTSQVGSSSQASDDLAEQGTAADQSSDVTQNSIVDEPTM